MLFVEFRKVLEGSLKEGIMKIEMKEDGSKLISLIKIKDRLISSMILVDRHETGIVSIST